MKKSLFATATLVALTTQASLASLTLSYIFNGKGNWSIDGVGATSNPVGSLNIEVPTGSVVERAFLYSSARNLSIAPTINFDGTVLGSGDFTALGFGPSSLQAFRADVTAQVASTVAGGGGIFNFDILSESSNGLVDGEVLAVVYSNPNEAERTIALLDGFSSSAGDSFFVATNPLPDTTAPGFEALLSLGIGFGFQPTNQISTVDVNGRRLTSSAGSFDDGQGANGALITVGGEGDDPSNPNPNASSGDDELYDLAQGNSVNSAPFVSEGDALITIETTNPSNDDNIFFAGFNITAEANVDDTEPPEPPTNAVPEPSTVGIIGVSALGVLLAVRRRFAKRQKNA